METIAIRLVPNPENPKLGRKYVGSVEYAVPKEGRDGKIITGLDENSIDLINYEGSDQKTKIAAVKKERESLEKLLGVELHPGAEFWNKFYVELGGDEQSLDFTNPKDRLVYAFLLANRYVAPSEDAITDDEDFAQCSFFFFREKEEMTKTAQKQIKTDKAISKLSNLAEENPNKLRTVYAYLFGISHEDTEPDTAYVKLREFLNDPDKDTQKKNVDKFLQAIDKTPEEMETKLILDKAVKKHIVSHRGNVYRRGEAVFGNNYDEALAYLSDPVHSGELISLQKETKGK